VEQSLSALESTDSLGLLDDWRWLLNLLAEDVTLNEVWKPDLGLVAKELARGDREDLVNFFERELLGLSDEAENHAPGYEIEPGVKTEGASRAHDSLHSREGQRKDTSEGVVDADSPGHTLFTLDGGENLCRVLEGNRAFSEGVADGEEVDEPRMPWSDEVRQLES
jgi:hypothetical protein